MLFFCFTHIDGKKQFALTQSAAVSGQWMQVLAKQEVRGCKLFSVMRQRLLDTLMTKATVKLLSLRGKV